MRFRTNIAAFLIGAAILPVPAATAQDAASARAFIQSLYALYAKNGKGVTLTGRYYDSTLLHLVTVDNKLNAGEIGVLEGDPVCGCQDWSGIWDLNVDVKMESPARAVAGVTFALAAPQGRRRSDLRYLHITLVPERGQWRINNIDDQSDPKAPFDLRNELEKDIASLSRKPN